MAEISLVIPMIPKGKLFYQVIYNLGLISQVYKWLVKLLFLTENAMSRVLSTLI